MSGPGEVTPIALRNLGFGARGQASDIKIVAEQILKTRQKLNEILAANTGQPLEKIAEDTERDNYLSAEEAKAYGLVDEIIVKH